MKGQPILPGKTLLFVDEIQESSGAIASLRYFFEQMPDLHVIGAGSLLEMTLRAENLTMPVGRVEFLNSHFPGTARSRKECAFRSLLSYLSGGEVGVPE